jgi:ParB family chromosome partitioning protein
MGSKNSIDVYGAAGKTNLLMFDPDKLTLVTDEKHPLFDPRVHDPVDENMIRSIMFKGVVEPIVVWKDPESGETCVVDGRGRVKNAREANKRLRERGEEPKLIQATIGKGDANNVMAIMVLANEGRREPTALGRAKMAKRLVEAGYTEEQAAVFLHVSRPTVHNLLSLLSCTSVVREAVEAGKIAPTVAYGLAKLEPKDQRAKLDILLKAADGETNKRKRGKKMRDAEAGTEGGVPGSKMRSRREIEAMFNRSGLVAQPSKEAKEVLAWVLGLSDVEPFMIPPQPQSETIVKAS